MPGAAAKVRRGLGLLPAGPSPAPAPPAPPAAARTPGWPRRGHAALGDCLVLPSVGKTRARGGLSPRPVTPPGVGVVKMKIEKLQRPHRRGDPIAIHPTHPGGPGLRVYNHKRLRLRGCPGRQGRGLCDRPHVWAGWGQPLAWLRTQSGAGTGRGWGGPGSGRAYVVYARRTPQAPTNLRLIAIDSQLKCIALDFSESGLNPTWCCVPAGTASDFPPSRSSVQ